MKTIIITVDVNDADYVTNQLTCNDEHVSTIIELISKFKGSHVIDTRDKDWEKIITNCLTKEEELKLIELLGVDVRWFDVYHTLFSVMDNEYPHTLISLEVLTSEQFISFRNS